MNQSMIEFVFCIWIAIEAAHTKHTKTTHQHKSSKKALNVMSNRHHNNRVDGWNDRPGRNHHRRCTCPPDVITSTAWPDVSTTQEAVTTTIMSSAGTSGSMPSSPSTAIPSSTAAPSPQTSSNGNVQPGAQVINSNSASANLAQNIEVHIDLDSIGAAQRARAQSGPQNKQKLQNKQKQNHQVHKNNNNSNNNNKNDQKKNWSLIVSIVNSLILY